MFLKKALDRKIENTLNELSPNRYDRQATRSNKRYLPLIHDKINYPLDHKKFPTNDRPEIIQSRKYVQGLVDPDILELRKKRWNISAMPDKYERTELKKTLFEVKFGLKDFNVVKLNPKKIELGTDSRNVYYYSWNSSTYVDKIEKRTKNLEELHKAKKNSLYFQKRINEKKNKSSDLLGDNEKWLGNIN